MKTIKLIALTLFLGTISIAKSFAQDGMEDVVYLKNGNVYRGIIVEQVPNVSLKVQTIGGNIFSVAIADVSKITKEIKVFPHGDFHPFGGFNPFHQHGMDSTHREFHSKRRGYFFQSQLLIENLQGGARIINGYKFGRLGYLGIGIGVDIVKASPFNGRVNNLDRTALSGTYLPLFIYYGGDILRSRITPFYAIEAGVTMLSPMGGGDMFHHGPEFRKGDMQGGMMGALAFGVKFNTKCRVHFDLSAVADFKNINYTQTTTQYDVFGNPYQFREKKNASLLFPGIRFGIGF